MLQVGTICIVDEAYNGSACAGEFKIAAKLGTTQRFVVALADPDKICPGNQVIAATGEGIPDDVCTQVDKELDLIHELQFEGYFLTMWEIVEFCRENDIPIIVFDMSQKGSLASIVQGGPEGTLVRE